MYRVLLAGWLLCAAYPGVSGAEPPVVEVEPKMHIFSEQGGLLRVEATARPSDAWWRFEMDQEARWIVVRAHGYGYAYGYGYNLFGSQFVDFEAFGNYTQSGRNGVLFFADAEFRVVQPGAQGFAPFYVKPRVE